MRENRVKKKLAAGQPAIGSVLSLPDPFVAELMAGAGFDFILVEMEHSPLTISELQNVLIGLHPTESTVLVRAAWNDVVMIKQILDVGAEGLVIPWINTAEEARRAVAAAKYPPRGIRGCGPRRAARLSSSRESYLLQADDQILVLGQIETLEAVNHLDAILETEGLDGIMVGPADLACSMGYLHDLTNPAVDAMIETILGKCQAHGVPFGMFTGTLERARQWIGRGGLIATVGGDVPFILEGIARTRQAVEEWLAGRDGSPP